MNKTRVLVAVLNWGLGHATRSIPVVRELLQQQCEVVLASDGAALELLRQEFPQLEACSYPPYNIRYATAAWQLPWVLARQLPGILRTIEAEQKLTRKLVVEKDIRLIISDNRYGVYHPSVTSVWLGHQLQLLMPAGWQWAAGALNKVHNRLLDKFDEFWVPDYARSLLTGRLSSSNRPVQYVGVLSRFRAPVPPPERPYPLVAVLSGPEPQRTLLENALRRQLALLPVHGLLVRGTGTNSHIRTANGYDEVDFMPTEPLNRLMYHARLVVARSGYSTIMDLCRLGKSALLIPTPGQPEQQYLATSLAQAGYFNIQQQHQLNLIEAWNQHHNLPKPKFPETTKLLTHAIERVVQTNSNVIQQPTHP